MEPDFTNREISHFFEEIKNSLARIEAQVVKTNGRVTLLEYWKQSLMGKLAGGLAVASFFWALLMKWI